jgi:hypothetical protein
MCRAELSPAVTRTATNDGVEIFTIENAPLDRSHSYSLPLASLSVTNEPPSVCCWQCSHGFKQYVWFRNDQKQWQSMSFQDSFAVVNCGANQKVRTNGCEYQCDLVAATQTNTATGKVRDLLIEAKYVEYDKGNGDWHRLSIQDSSTIVNSRHDQFFTLNGATYRYDILNMTRTNTTTGYTRRIRFVDG